MFTLTDTEIMRESGAIMLWQEGEIYDENGEPTLDTWADRFTHLDSTPAAGEAMVSAIREFVSRIHPADLAKYLNTYSEFALIHDYWLTRNSHGAGFWDRGLGDSGDRMSDAAQDGSYMLYIPNDSPESWDWE